MNPFILCAFYCEIHKFLDYFYELLSKSDCNCAILRADETDSSIASGFRDVSEEAGGISPLRKEVLFMKFSIKGRNMNVSERTKDHVEKKIGKLSKFFVEDTTAHVTLSNQKDDYTIEVSIPIKNSLIRAEETSNDLYVSIDLVEEVLERQIKRHRTKLIDKNQSASSFSELFIESDETADDENEIRIEKVKRFDFKPMTAEEACLQMELLGHSFFVFKDADTNETCVVYKRKNNTYGIIEPEV